MSNLSKFAMAKFALAGAAVSLMTLASGASQAGCVPSKPNGWEVPVTMVTLGAGIASYYTAILYTSATPGQWGGSGNQLLSTHTTSLGSLTQPFAANSAEQLQMTVKTGDIVTITLLSHGNVKVNFTAKCNTPNSISYSPATFLSPNDTFLLFNFGTPFKIPS